MAELIAFPQRKLAPAPAQKAQRRAEPLMSTYARACAIASDLAAIGAAIKDPMLRDLAQRTEDAALDLAHELFQPPRSAG